MISYIMSQPNTRPRLQPQLVHSDHDEHHIPRKPVGDHQMSSSTRPVFNFAATYQKVNFLLET